MHLSMPWFLFLALPLGLAGSWAASEARSPGGLRRGDRLFLGVLGWVPFLLWLLMQLLPPGRTP